MTTKPDHAFGRTAESEAASTAARRLAEALTEKALSGNEAYLRLWEKLEPNIRARGNGDIADRYEVTRRRKMQ